MQSAAHAHSAGQARTTASALSRTAATPATLAATTVLSARPGSARARARRTLLRNDDATGDRIEVEHLAYEVAQRDHEFGGFRCAAGHHVVRRAHRETHLLLGPEQDDVGE